jgi:hypothetical protein
MGDIQTSNQDILNDIQNLQMSEQQLLNALETNPNLTNDQQQQMISQIQNLAQMRLNLYTTLGDLTNFYNNNLLTSQNTLTDQLTAIQVVEKQLANAENELGMITDDINNQKRLIEVNTYYGDKYAEHSKLMQIIIFTIIPVIIVVFIYRKGFIPSIIHHILLTIIIIIGLYYFFQTYSSIISRNNINYDEYDWSFDPSSAPKPESSVSTSGSGSGSSGGICVGQQCCSDDQTYNVTMNMCIDNSDLSSSTTGTVPAPTIASSMTSTPAPTTTTSPTTTSPTTTTPASNVGSIFSSII